MPEIPTQFTEGIGLSVGAKTKQFQIQMPSGVNADSLTAIHMSGYSLMQIHLPANWNSTTLMVLSAYTEPDPNNPSGTYNILSDSNNVRTQIPATAPNNSYVFVNDKGTTVAACMWIRLRSVSTQTIGGATIGITLKG